ncbi:hypothetical protein ACCT03_33700 [Rhizobium johnstonii]|uniref:helix-turn-helix domain-containing protein n=1 Tax=Rhizobium TaxID=379 RepID=UPI001030078C|nr:helix-turn-helix transcriptional regulator [Rhizobium leguminosarum]TBF22326.1 XRE family transcriptional regulator [Rhizobium leguminosarum]TBH45436.1 XRE family transcriptional regulator [Rhizobium leguminosarum]
MDNVVAYPNNEGVVDDAHTIRQIRIRKGLSIVQAAAALRTTPSNIELWEANPGMGPKRFVVSNHFDNFLRENDPGCGKNLLFNRYPLSLARDILSLNVEEIAALFGYKKSTWQKFESHTRVLSADDLARLEDMVRERFSVVCGQPG